MSRAIVKAAAADMEMVEAAISAAAEAMEQTYYETEYAAFVTARMREKVSKLKSRQQPWLPPCVPAHVHH